MDMSPMPSAPRNEDEGTAREVRLIFFVEAFLKNLRSGGSLDPEPYLAASEELRPDLEPLLLAVLRLEACAIALERYADGAVDFEGREAREV